MFGLRKTTTMFKVCLLLSLASGAYAASHNGTVNGDNEATCGCLVKKGSDGKCPATTTGAGGEQLWQDGAGTRRSPTTANGCCQMSADKKISITSITCKPNAYICPKLAVGAVKHSNPLTCTEISKTSFVCVCATQWELEAAVRALTTNIIIVVVLFGGFFSVYMFHWFCWKKWSCSKDANPSEELRGAGGCCDYTRHCFGIGCDLCFYYTVCCPCRFCYWSTQCCCYQKTMTQAQANLHEKDLCKSGKNKQFSGAVNGAPSILEMSV